jgi:hypothetical protein
LRDKDGEPISLRLSDKLRALELLGKYQSMFTDKQEIEHSGSVVYLPPGADDKGF